MRGKKSSEESNKVTMFPGASVDLENTVIDDNMDEALRESIKREADELEARLNNNPAMKGIGASDDMFEKIVASLKEMGVWEEEEGSVSEGEKQTDGEKDILKPGEKPEEQKKLEMSKTYGMETQDNLKSGKTYGAETQDSLESEKTYGMETQDSLESEKIYGTEMSGSLETENNQCKNQKKMKFETVQEITDIDLDASTMKEVVQNASGDKLGQTTQNINFESKVETSADNQNPEFEIEHGEQEMNLENSGQKNGLAKNADKRLDAERNMRLGDADLDRNTDLERNDNLVRDADLEGNEECISNSKETSIEVGDNLDLEEIYKLLPENDRMAMELGHRVKKEKEERRRKRKRRDKVIKRAVIVAASVVVVYSAGMTSGANRRLVSQIWSVLRENFGMRMSVNYVDIEKYVESRDKAEYQAIKDIGEKLGVPPVYFKYLPEEMKFLNYDIQTNWNQATVFYEYNDTIMSVQIIKDSKDRVSYFQLDGATGETEFIENNQDIKIKLQEAGDEKEKSYLAQFGENDCTYVINGIIEYSEMQKILKNIIFFEK